MSTSSTSRRRVPAYVPAASPLKSAVSKRSVHTAEEWEDEVDDSLDAGSERSSSVARRRGETPRTPVRRVAARVKTPVRVSPVRSQKSNSVSTSKRPGPSSSSRPKTQSALISALSMLFEVLLAVIRLIHTVLAPVYPYLFLTAFALVAISWASYGLLNVIPPLLFQIPGHLLRVVLPSFRGSSTSDMAIGQGLALLPLRTLATPACVLTGQLCTLSFVNQTSGWSWTRREPEVDVGVVARSLVKEAKGAKDIFQSIALLSDGGLMDRLDYVRIWELGAAIQIGSSLEEKDIVSQQLYDLGNLAKDLSDQLVETNAMAVDAFTWLQWEFASLVKVLSLPSNQRPPAEQLSKRLNDLLNRLSSTLTSLHKRASTAHQLAQRGSTQGLSLRSSVNTIGGELRKAHERSPGWRSAVDKANHFFVGGDPTKSELIARDLRLTDLTINSLSTLVRDLESSRSGIKGFRDQIGFFDASMMGFHLGAGAHVGMGPEEEVRMLAEVVDEFGTAVGRAKGGRRGAEVPAIDAE